MDCWLIKNMASGQKEKYVALFRGINVGGHKKAPMAELRKVLESIGYESVTTILNSGNVVFEAKKSPEKDLVKAIESAFQKKFGFESKTMIRSMSEIEALIELNPFKNVEVNEDVRLYVTFLREKPLPYKSSQGDFEILHKTERELFSVLTVKSARSVDSMAFLEKQFGKDITTRNWNTIEKIARL